MSLQPLSERKTRRAAQMTGLPIDRVLVHHSHVWYARVVRDGGHEHVAIDPRTWAVDVDTGGCWSSCTTTRFGCVSPYGWTP